MRNRKVILVRYLNKSEEHPLSRPHKIQKITETDGSVKYYNMNASYSSRTGKREIDPSTFTTTWDRKPHEVRSKTKQATWNVIRVKFKPGEGPGRDKSDKFSRPKKVYEIISETNIEYAPYGDRGTAKRIDANTFITEWENAGKTPTPKPLRKYDDVTLQKLGYTIEEVRGIRERKFSAKDVKLVTKRLGIKNAEARELLAKHDGNRHKIYEANPPKTKGIRINEEWKTNIPGEKTPRVRHTKKKTHLPKVSKSKKKIIKKKRTGGRF